MNYNDHFEGQGPFDVDTQGEESTKQTDIREDIQDVAISFRSKPTSKGNERRSALLQGKQNNFSNAKEQNSNSSKQLPNNSIFNGFFKQNIQKSQQIQKSIYNSSKNQNNNVYITPNPNCKNLNGPKLQGIKRISSPGNRNFNSSGKLSNFHFSQMSKNPIFENSSQICAQIHPEVQEFLKKYFPRNYQLQQYQGQYVTIEDFVDILFEEFEQVIGKDNMTNIVFQFSEQLVRVFKTDQIFFDDLFAKTQQNGLLGLIFQVFKAIQQEEKANKENSHHSKRITQITPPVFKQSKISLGEESLRNSRPKHFSRMTSDKSIYGLWNSNNFSSQTDKISLDQIFCQKSITSTDNSRVRGQNIQELKLILTEYIQEIYDQASKKLSKKFYQQTKKIALKYKQTQQLLEKLNEKLSAHYDVITCQKQYEKKLIQLKEKENLLMKKIQTLEQEKNQLKILQDQEKTQHLSISQELKSLKQKLEKYQNAIFQKAMQKQTSQETKENNHKDQKSKTTDKNHQQGSKTAFQFKINTYTQHRQMTPISNVRTYSPYTPKYIGNNNRIEGPKERNHSPINSRISFNRTPNPSLSISRVQKVQMGAPVQLGRPVSPMTRLGISTVGPSNPSLGTPLNNNTPHGSRVLTISPMRTNIK